MPKTRKSKARAPAAAAGARAILAAAASLFAENGFDGASVASIACKAGVCKANIFHHFRTKDDLYIAVMQEAGGAHADYAERLHAEPISSADKVRKFIDFEIRNVLHNRQHARLTLREMSDGGHRPIQKLAQLVFQRNFSAVVELFEQGRIRGEFRATTDTAAAAMMLCGAIMLYFNAHDVLREFRELDASEQPAVYAARMASMILDAVKISPPVHPFPPVGT